MRLTLIKVTNARKEGEYPISKCRFQTFSRRLFQFKVRDYLEGSAVDNHLLAFMIDVRMGQRELLGTFEHLVMVAVLRKKDRAAGLDIWTEIQTRAQRDVLIGAVYTTLDRLETKGYVISEWELPTSKSGERPRKLFELTKEGKETLFRTRDALNLMWEGQEEAIPKARPQAPRLNLRKGQGGPPSGKRKSHADRGPQATK